MREEDIGRVRQRASQKRKRLAELTARRAERNRERESYRRQYIQVANVHKREGLDPIQGAPVPGIIVVQNAKALRFKQYMWAAFVAGTLLAAGLFGVALQQHAAGAVFGLVFMGLLASVFGAAIIISTLSDPERPESESMLVTVTRVAGTAMAISLFAILWLRFGQNVQTIEQMAIPIAVLELSLFVLGGTFAAIAGIYSWSREINARYETATNDVIEYEQEIVNLTIDLDALKFEEEIEVLEHEQRLASLGPPEKVAVEPGKP